MSWGTLVRRPENTVEPDHLRQTVPRPRRWHIMDHPLRRPEEILAYRPLQQMLSAKPKVLWSIGPRDSALSAMRLMADKNIGVLSERDCVRRLVLAGKSPEATPVADVMIRDVVKVDIAKTFADCLKLMHEHHIRHLPVLENGIVVGVISIRDLLGEAAAHHADKHRADGNNN